MTTMLDYLENAALKYPDLIAYEDESAKLTFADVAYKAKQVGSLLAPYIQPKQPVVVIAQKSVWTPSLYMGIAYAGCFYVPIGIDQPIDRMNTMLNFIDSSIILTDGMCDDIVSSLSFNGKIISLSNASQIDENEINNRKNKLLDIDPLYVLFTSGSTGTPKGIITSHRSVMDSVTAYIEAFFIGQEEVFGSQAAFDYIAAIRDIYFPIFTGAKTVLIPKKLFSTPHTLFEYINNYGVTTLCWAASALSLCCTLNVFKQAALKTVTKVIFAGSVLPGRHLKIWQENLPDAVFINHYGPTEITASCTYYIVNHRVENNEVLPIGVPFRNTDVFLLDGNNSAVPEGEIGEICVRDIKLAIGYYKDEIKTAEAFINNPLQSSYSQRIYKTGDLGSFHEDGNLMFHGRSDRQIKHMGYRIELDEIEAAALQVEGIGACACVYKTEEEIISLYYEGSIDKKTIAVHLRKVLPGYMVPREFTKLGSLPRTSNGKIDMRGIL